MVKFGFDVFWPKCNMLVGAKTVAEGHGSHMLHDITICYEGSPDQEQCSSQLG